MPQRCDILVLGGGPAGIATAVALQRRGLQVVVAERTHYQLARPGEWLQPASEPVLKALGIWEQLAAAHLLVPATRLSFWGRPEKHSSAPEAGGWLIDRAAFDGSLARAAEAAGVLVYCNVRPTDARRVSYGWSVTLSGEGCGGKLQARYVVDATGRSAWMARRMGALERTVDELIAFIGKYNRPATESTLVIEAVPDGWWYCVPAGDKSVLAAFLTDRHDRRVTSREFYLKQLASTGHILPRVCGSGRPSVRVISASTYGFDRCAGNRWLSVGEAAFGIDPLSGCGIALALESGLYAAEAIVAAMGGAASSLAVYEHGARARFAAQLRARQYYYALEERWPSSFFWASRHD